MLDGLKMCSPRQRNTYLERIETAAVPTKIHQPCRLHQSPCAVPGTRRTKATPFPVSVALAGQRMTCWERIAIPTSSTAAVPIASRIWAMESSKWNPTCPMIWSEMMTAARWRRGSLNFGSRTGYGLPRIVNVGPEGAGTACALIRAPHASALQKHF